METIEYSNFSNSFAERRNFSRHCSQQNDLTIDGTPKFLVVDMKDTKHISVRKQQGGFQAGDIEMIFQYGTMFGDEKVLLTNKDVDGVIRSLKQKIKKFERLRNRVVVVRGNRFVTCYPCKPSKIKRLMRRNCQKG